MIEITILAFNYGNAGSYPNGPGMCLVNFCKELISLGIKVNVFSKLKSSFRENFVFDISNKKKLVDCISSSSVVHHWSGISKEFIDIVNLSKNKLNSKIIIGPNLIDTVELDKERTYLGQIKFDYLLTVNNYLKFKISKTHNIDVGKIGILKTGPDLRSWFPINSSLKDNTILWKGNSKHFVKDVEFALRLEKELPQYKFKFIGYPNPYNYYNHINDARKSKIAIITSLSETMCLANLESWASGIPTILHPKIYEHGINYKTGIIVSKDIGEYKKAIIEIMEDDNLYNELSIECRNYVLENYNTKNIAMEYLEKYVS